MRRSAQLVYHAREAFLLVLGLTTRPQPYHFAGYQAFRTTPRRGKNGGCSQRAGKLESGDQRGNTHAVRGNGRGGGGGIDNTVVVFLWELPMVAERSEATGTLVFFVGAALIANCFKVPF